MSTAIVVDCLNLLSGLRIYERGEENLGVALRGLLQVFGPPDAALLFVEETLAAGRHAIVAAAHSAGFTIRIAATTIESLIITSMVELSHDHSHIVLVSGDADFAPAVRAITGRGTRVTVVAAARCLAASLPPAATSNVELLTIVSAGRAPGVVDASWHQLTAEDAAFLRGLPSDQIPSLRAVSAGIRLEKHLKELCTQRGVVLPSNGGISMMNDALLKVGAYGKVWHRKVALWGAIRNEAAHAADRAFSPDDLHQMERGIEEFVRSGHA